MKDQPFITQPMSLWLDLVRGLAALAVVIGHAAQMNVYTGWFPFSIFFQKNAVVVFFVLSGMVIAASVDRSAQSLSSFALARASRIVPVAWAAIAVSLAVSALDAAMPGGPIFAEDRDWNNPAETLLAATFLSQSYTTGFPPNAPYWSLCYEVWFYALFGAATFLKGPSRLIWLGLLATIAGPNILLLLPVWAVGVILVRVRAAKHVPAGLAACFVFLAALALFLTPQYATQVFWLLRPLVPWQLGSSLYALTDLLLGVAMAAGFAGLRTLSERGLVLPDRAEPAIRWGADMSFSLYLLHWPLLKLAHMTGLTAGDDPFAFMAIVAAIVAISGAFAAVTEHKRHLVRATLERLLRRQPDVAAA